MAYGTFIKDSIELKSAFENIISNSLLIVKAKPVKSRKSKNVTTFQVKVIRRLIYVNQFYKVWKFHVCTTNLGDCIKVKKLSISILLRPFKHKNDDIGQCMPPNTDRKNTYAVRN